MLREKVLSGKVNCECYRKMCQEAGIRAYLTVRLYPGMSSTSQELDHDEGIHIGTQDPDAIMNLVLRELAKNSGSNDASYHDEL